MSEPIHWSDLLYDYSGKMDYDPVLLVAEILAIYTVIWVYLYWARLCRNVVRMERDGLWAARSALGEIDELCRRWPDRLPAERLATAVRGVIGKHRRAVGTQSGGR